MTSIMNWLRVVSDDYGMWRCEEAADEIERLNAENARLREALSYYLARDEEKPYCWQHSRNDAEKMALIAMSNSSGMLTSSVVKDCLTTDCATRRQIINERDRTFALMLARAEAAEGRAARLREALTKIIRQHERFVPDDELGDLHYQGGLEVCSDIARAALAEKES